MTLSDRLAAAAKVRAEAARPSDAASTMMSPVRERPLRARPNGGKRILVDATHPATTVEPDPAAAPESVCPSCGRTGELGMVDLPGRAQHWSCASCGTLWQVDLPTPTAF